MVALGRIPEQPRIFRGWHFGTAAQLASTKNPIFLRAPGGINCPSAGVDFQFVFQE
jgi:hypothetical protein